MDYLSKEHEKAIEELKAGKFDTALEHIQVALQINKSHPVLLAERGTIYMYLKRKVEALEDMDLAVYLDPENSYRYSSRAYIKDFFGDTPGAIEDYEKCLELDPEDIIAMNNLGLLIEKQGNRKKAERYFKQTDDLLKQNPDWKNRVATPDEKAQNETKETPVLPDATLESTTFQSTDEDKTSASKVVKDVFTKKSVFKEFLQFVMNGFKIK